MPDRPQPPAAPGPTIALLTMGRLVERRATAALAELGLSVRALGALGHLARDPGVTFTELARRGGVTVQSMHTALAGLVESGAVRSSTGSGRGRSAALEVTAAGRELLARAHAVLADLDEELFGPAAREAGEHLGAVAAALLARRA